MDRLKQYKDAANTKKIDNDKLMKEIEVAKKAFIEALQKKLLSQTESNSEQSSWKGSMMN